MNIVFGPHISNSIPLLNDQEHISFSSELELNVTVSPSQTVIEGSGVKTGSELAVRIVDTITVQRFVSEIVAVYTPSPKPSIKSVV